jgi:hypothetical protein
MQQHETGNGQRQHGTSRQEFPQTSLTITIPKAQKHPLLYIAHIITMAQEKQGNIANLRYVHKG